MLTGQGTNYLDDYRKQKDNKAESYWESKILIRTSQNLMRWPVITFALGMCCSEANVINHTAKSAGRSISGPNWYFTQPWLIWSSLCLYFTNPTKPWLTSGLDCTHFSVALEGSGNEKKWYSGRTKKAERTMKKCCSFTFLAGLNWPLQRPICGVPVHHSWFHMWLFLDEGFKAYLLITTLLLTTLHPLHFIMVNYCLSKQPS